MVRHLLDPRDRRKRQLGLEAVAARNDGQTGRARCLRRRAIEVDGLDRDIIAILELDGAAEMDGRRIDKILASRLEPEAAARHAQQQEAALRTARPRKNAQAR